MAAVGHAGAWSNCYSAVRPSIQFSQQLGEIAVARLRRGGLEGTAQRGHNAGMSGRNVDPNDPSVHVTQFRRRNIFVFQLHLDWETTKGPGKFRRSPICGKQAPT